MKNFYIENFALRIIFCVVCFYAIWFTINFVVSQFIQHSPMHVGIIDIVVPLVCGIMQAYQWKPKDQ